MHLLHWVMLVVTDMLDHLATLVVKVIPVALDISVV